MDKLLGRYPEDYQDEDEYQEEEDEDEEEGESGLPHPERKTHLDIGPDLRPHVNTLFGSRTGIFGIPGSGKSNTVAVLLEELGEYQCPLLVLDTENENAGLCSSDYFLNPNWENATSITPANAYQFGQAIMENNLQVVLNLQSYASDDEAAEVMIALVQGINDWEESQSMRVPCAVVLDEAHKWLPQKAAMSTLSKIKDENGDTLLYKLQQCFLGTLASRGRKRGMGLIFATQRLAMLDKNLIMCEWLFLLRQTLPNDLQAYRRMGCPPEVAQKLENGQAYVITPTKEHGTYQIRKRFSESGANTPGLAELEEYKRVRQARQRQKTEQTQQPEPPTAPPQPSRSPLALPATSADRALQMKQRREAKLRELRSRKSSAQEEKHTEPMAGLVKLGKETYITAEQFEQAIELRKSGASTGYRDLMETFTLSEHHAKAFNGLVRDAIAERVSE